MPKTFIMTPHHLFAKYIYDIYFFIKYSYSEAAVQRCAKEKMFLKYAANLQEKTHAEVAPLRTPMLCNFIEIALWHGCSTVNLLPIFRILFPKSK